MKSVHTVSARRAPRVSLVPALAALLAVVSLPAAANTFTVTTGSDGSQQVGNTTTCAEVDGSNQPTGKCSLRAAIAVGNAISGAHTINFDPSVLTVTVINGAMAQLRAQFTVTGAFPARTAIDGNGHGCLDLTDSGDPVVNHQKGATGSTIQNLVIGNCSGAGISANGHGYTFNNNFIGVNSLGLAAWANNGNGISLSASTAYDDQFVDTSALNALNNALPAQPVSAADISNFSANLATALQNLQPNTISGNVISGNALNGVELFSKNLAGTLLSNNMIGTDPTGAIAIANGQNGVHLVGSTFGNLIGPGNVVAGNTQNGIQIDAGAVFLPNFIMGNRIGLSNINGTHVGNTLGGIGVDSKPSSDPAYFNPSMTALVIGPLNVIADNQGANNNAFPDVMGSDNAGILISGASTGVKVLGNSIGIAEFPAGAPLAAKAYANLGDGIIVTTSGNQIGGSGAADGNVIANNARHGIVVRGSATTGNNILGNSIGVHPGLAGNLALGNGVDGIHIDAASSTTMGGTGAKDFNTIAANGRNGIKIVNGGTQNGWGNLAQRNLIYHNATASAGIGIDLDFLQNAANPLHAEIPANYANLDQAQPVICIGPGDSGACAGSTAPKSTGGLTSLQWALATHGPANFRMEFFAIDQADPKAATQMTYLGQQLITTDASGTPNSAVCPQGRCGTTLSVSTGGAYLLMTATDITALTDVPGGGNDWKANLKCFIGKFGDPTGILQACTANNTSEFSATVNVPQAPPSAVTAAATAITATGATFNGMVNDNGVITAASFEYGLDTSYGTTLAATPASIVAGAGNTPVSATTNALACNTTYHFRVNANNGVGGTINGSDMSFTTLACPAQAPSVTTTAATNITATTATINGVVSANGAQTGVSFEYGTTTNYGSSINATPSSLPAGASNANVAGNISGLACGTQYHFRVEAFNGVGGPQLGNDLSFTTTACPAPTAVTLAATNVTTSSITFNGNVGPNGNDTAVHFDYGADINYGSVANGSPATVLAAAGATAVSATIATQCGTTVHFRVRANNVIGTTNGGDLTATTGACGATPPTVSTSAATNITATGATLNGSGNANNYTTSANFDYGTTTSYGQSVAAIPSLLSGTSATALSANLSALACGTTYHFRLSATNAGGSVSTADRTFTTSPCPGQAPTANTGVASAITATSATLNAAVSANGAATVVSFDYGTTMAYGLSAPATQSPLAQNASNAAVSATVTGLSCAQTYHFRVNANNGNGGTIYSIDQIFTTAACPAQIPTATSLAATAVTATSATLNGTINANGAATTVSFAYGATAAYGSTAAATPASLPANAVGTTVSAAIGGLSCATSYHFRVDATNANGSGHGGDLSFTTAACPAVTTYTGPTATGTGTATAVLSGGGPGCSLVNPAFVAVPAALPPGVSFPDGLFRFTASGCSGSITLTVTFPTAFSAGVQYWKYGPTSSQTSDHWYTLGAGNNLSLAGNVATFTITDGGFGDDDLSVDGTIIDAGGPSLAATVVPQAAVPAPALDARSLAMLIALLAALGAVAVRKKSSR